MALHDAALKDDYFVSRKLAPNVDFWRCVCSYCVLGLIRLYHDLSGLIYRAMGNFDPLDMN